MIDKVYEILVDKGIELPTQGEDFNLAEYLQDSLEFVAAMVEIEDNLGIEISDEIFGYESMVSFHTFCRLLEREVLMLE